MEGGGCPFHVDRVTDARTPMACETIRHRLLTLNLLTFYQDAKKENGYKIIVYVCS